MHRYFPVPKLWTWKFHSESTSRRGRNAEVGGSTVAEDRGGAEGVQEARGNRSSWSGNRRTGSERGYEGIDSLIFLHPHSIFVRDRNSASQLRRIQMYWISTYIFTICEQPSTFLPWSVPSTCRFMHAIRKKFYWPKVRRFTKSSNTRRVT